MTALHDLLTRNDGEKEQVEPFWVCYVEGTDGGYHYKHYLLVKAQTEAERLARLTGKTVYLFECIGECETELPSIKWRIPDYFMPKLGPVWSLR